MPPRFHWHPNAQAFAGREEIADADGPARAHIPAHPLGKALNALRATLGGNTAFCVSDTCPPDLDTLAPHLFATLTGGTSGSPKAILRNHASWIKSFETNAAHFEYNDHDRIAVLGALSHSLALYGVLEGLHLGLDVHALSNLKPTAQADALQASACTILYATPTQLRLLPAGKPLPHVRLILCGGGALGKVIRAHMKTLCPNADLHIFYGAAETSFITLSDAQTPEGSVGRAYPQVEIAVHNPDETGAGTIWVRSPYLFERYLQGRSPHTKRDGNWLTLGEIGRLDPQGYLYLLGRAGRVFNIADQTIYPEEIEASLLSEADLTQCAVLARPDPLRGHHLIFAVDGAEDTARRANLLTYCKSRQIPPPREIFFLDPFPLLPSGKPDLLHIARLTGCSL